MAQILIVGVEKFFTSKRTQELSLLYRLQQSSEAVSKKCPSGDASILLVLLGAVRHPLRSLPLSFSAGFTLQMHLFAVKLHTAFCAILEDEQFPVKHNRLSAFDFEEGHTIILPDERGKINREKDR
jgi:hypothetical protein